MSEILFDFNVISDNSKLILTNYKINTGKKNDNGEIIPHNVDIVVMDTLAPFRIKVDILDSSITAISNEKIAKSLKSQNYFYVVLDEAKAKPYTKSGGFGVAYSIRAKIAKIEVVKKHSMSTTQGFPDSKE